MGSSRLPGKVLMPILKKPVLWHVYQRTKRAKRIDQVIIATSDKKADDKIAKFCETNNIPIFRGSESDVLDRYFQAAKKNKADYIVRVTADCPLIDSELVGKLIRNFTSGNYDYAGIAAGAGASTLNINRFPQGLDAEIFSFGALKTAWGNAKDPLEREHATAYIWKRPKKFRIGPPQVPDVDHSMYYRLTLDWPEDLKLIRIIYEKLYTQNKYFGFKDIINLLEIHPALAIINKKYLDKTTEGFWRQKLLSEFENIKKPKFTNIKKLDAVVVPAAEETKVEGETKQRIDEGLQIYKKTNNNCLFIYLGVKAGKDYFANYVKDKINLKRTVVLTSRNEASTKTQLKDFSKFLDDKNVKSILFVSSAYHLPRFQRYCKKFIVAKKYKLFYWPVGEIENQKVLIDREISKIIRYARKGDVSLIL